MKVPYVETTVANIEYYKPKVFLLHDTGIGSAEFAARTAYDSFENSTNEVVRELNTDIEYMHNDETEFYDAAQELNQVYQSELLDKLAWTYFHHSVLEHASLTFLIKGTSRGVLQELARHRIASYTVRSTRYTMGTVLNAFNASKYANDSKRYFIETMINADMLVVAQTEYQGFEWEATYDKLSFQKSFSSHDEWIDMTVAKKSKENLDGYSELAYAEPGAVFKMLESGPKKRNVGDSFKHIVTENWKVDLVMSINLRSFKNFLGLRLSGSAWFQIQWLAQAMQYVTPTKYLKLIIKD